jgi:para-nitrobenzyl esterase
MRKAAIALIVVAVLVVVAVNLWLGRGSDEAPAPERDDTTLRSTTSGDVVGFSDAHGARAWLGIPYAEPPVGARRWRSPGAAAPAAGVSETLAIGNLCPQLASLLSGSGQDAAPGSVVGDEDCLYLNVWSPPNARKLPVMFWIHGGGNSIGHGGSYNGANLAATRDVVVVTINYRLGFLGWFTHPALATGNPEDDSGNYGTLDIVRALEWTRDNIAAFGGDPANVTVFGESAGAFDTLAMMASPLTTGLFHRAIVQSGGFQTTISTGSQ